MQRALILLNPCGREAGRHKLKNGLKTQNMHFLPVFELTLASLTAIWVEQNQCPLHQSILLTMRYHFFLHYGWFFQNLGKKAVRTFMHTTVCISVRGWVIIIWTGLNIKIGITQKVSIWVMKLSFCQNDYPIREEFWQKISFITHILFELCLFWYLAQSR